MNEIKLGAKVHYVSKTGQYECAAEISATERSLFRPNVEAGHLRDLSTPGHVHLVVLTPGTPGEVSASTLETLPELSRPSRPNAPAGSTYAEWDIPHQPLSVDRDPAEGASHDAGSWHFPDECYRGL